MEIVLLQGAQADLLNAYARYGDRFYAEADAALEQIRTHPESAPVFRGAYRRKLILHTPYAVFYDIAGRRVMVKAVLDLRQDPRRILERLPPTD